MSSTVHRQCQCCCRRQHSYFTIVLSVQLESEVVISEVDVFCNIEGSSSRALQNWRRAIENLLRDKILLLRKVSTTSLHSTMTSSLCWSVLEQIINWIKKFVHTRQHFCLTVFMLLLCNSSVTQLHSWKKMALNSTAQGKSICTMRASSAMKSEQTMVDKPHKWKVV